MAQFGESGLFGQVLRRGNAGSIAVPRAPRPKRPANAAFIVVNLRRSSLLNLGLWLCKSPAPAIPGRVGKDTRVKLRCKWAEFAADESGATAIEYGLIAAGIALAIIEIIYALGTNLVAKLQSLATALK
ncbi:Flp pilus assembly pilin Flp [Bradyrhizobium sp. LB1.3]|jgi:Flp pilus assembly pilin Flp